MTEPSSVTGTVSIERIAIGSRGERDAVVLTAADRTWELRRPGAVPGTIDADLAALAGHRVTVLGHAGSAVLAVREVVPLD